MRTPRAIGVQDARDRLPVHENRSVAATDVIARERCKALHGGRIARQIRPFGGLAPRNVRQPSEHKIAARKDAFAGRAMEAPYVIKPIAEGSSIGVRIVREGDNLAPLDDWRYGEEVLVERVASQTAKHAPFGGVIPEVAAREHHAWVPRLLDEVMHEAQRIGVAGDKIGRAHV